MRAARLVGASLAVIGVACVPTRRGELIPEALDHLEKVFASQHAERTAQGKAAGVAEAE